MTYDFSKLTTEDSTALADAVLRTGERIHVWYKVDKRPGFFEKFSYRRRIISQTGARSDVEARSDKFEEARRFDERFSPNETYKPNEIHLKQMHVTKDKSDGSVEICVNNPERVPLSLKLGVSGRAQLVQIDGFYIFNGILEGSVRFDSGEAFLKHDDRTIAHKLGLMYAPSHVLETDCMSASSNERNGNKPHEDDDGNPVLYCDNCSKQMDNPVMMIEQISGGLYHNQTCMIKDLQLKQYLTQGTSKFSTTRVSLDDAIRLLKEGELQQSPEPKRITERLRTIDTLHEMVLLFGH